MFRNVKFDICMTMQLTQEIEISSIIHKMNSITHALESLLRQLLYRGLDLFILIFLSVPGSGEVLCYKLLIA